MSRHDQRCRRFGLVPLAGVLALAVGCKEPTTGADSARSASGPSAATIGRTAGPAGSTGSTAVPPATASAAAKAPCEAVPPGSGDYCEMLQLVTELSAGKRSFEELKQAVLARQLPPHKLGDGYLMIPVPKPPPGVDFDPRLMPADWEGTWGEVAMTYWLGKLTRQQYDELHRAAHPDCPVKQ